MEENKRPGLLSSSSCEDPKGCSIKSGEKSAFTGNPEVSPIGYPRNSKAYTYNLKNAKNLEIYKARKVTPISALGPPSSNGKKRKVWTMNLNEFGNQGWRTPPPELVGKGEGEEVKGESRIAAASGGGGGFFPPPKEKKLLFSNNPRSFWNGFFGGKRTRRYKKSKKVRKSRKSRK